MLKQLLSLALPSWVKPALLAAGAVSLFAAGLLVGIEYESKKHVAYVATQAERIVKVVEKQIQIVHSVEIKYRDRIRNVYLTGEKNVESAPLLVTADDSRQCTINAGFVRHHDAAWSDAVAAPAAESDREPAAVSLTDIAETNAHNAASCIAWRTQALELRSLYEQLRGAEKPADTDTQ